MGEWDREVDVLVFGSGIGALTTALVGRCEGLSVLLCEKTSQPGDTAATSGGTVWIPGSSPAQQRGVGDFAAVRSYLDAEIGERPEDAPLREAFLASGAEALDYLAARSEVKFSFNNPIPYPDYHPENTGGALRGRALSPLPFDTNVLGDDFALVRAPMPEFMILGGMMVARPEIPHFVRTWSSWASLRLVTRAVLRYGCDRLRFSRGTRLHLGNALIARLLHSLRAAGAEIAVNAALVELVRDNSRVAGAVVEINGKRLRIGARRGAMLATGGFGASASHRAALMQRDDIGESLVFPANVGQGLDYAQAVGAALDRAHDSPAFWMPSSTHTRADGTKALYPHIRDRPKPGMIAVNAKGLRFVNEAASYHDFVLAMFAAQLSEAWLICDRAFIRDYGIGMIPAVWQNLRPYIRSGYLATGETPEALAQRIGVDAEGLGRTVGEHNQFALTGVDLAFGKGSSALNRHNGDAAVKPNPCLRPIGSGPLFAVRVEPTPIGTAIGLRTDADARVLDAAGAPITGLYATGSDMSSIMRGHYPGPGITLGPSLIFAYRAARQMRLAANAPVGVSM